MDFRSLSFDLLSSRIFPYRSFKFRYPFKTRDFRWYLGATENARPDNARPSKLWELTSRDWTTWDHVARVDIARLVSMFKYLITKFFCYYECYTNCRYQFVLIVFWHTHGTRFTEARMSARHQCEASTWRHEAHFTAVVRGWCSWRFRRRWSRHCWHGRLTGFVLAAAAAAVVVTRL